MTTKTVEEQKKEQKFMFQFISHLTGERSAPFVSNWKEIIDIIDTAKEGEGPSDKDYVLLVAVLEGKESKIPSTPLITVKHLKGISEPHIEVA